MTIRQFLTKGLSFLALAAVAGLALHALAAPAPSGTSDAPRARLVTEPGAARLLSVRTQPVEEAAAYRRTRVYTGELRPARRTALAFELAGRVAAVEVDEGDRVDAGEVLARLDERRTQSRLAELEAELARERAALSEMEAGPRAQTIAAARAEVRGLTERLALAAVLRERREELISDGSVSLEEFDLAQTSEREAQAALDAAQSRLDELVEGTRAEQLERQRAVVAGLEASVERARIDLEDTVLRAPFDALVVRRERDEGAVVEAGTPLFELHEAGALEVRVGVPVEKAALLAPGDELALEVRGRRVSAVVDALVPDVDERTRTLDVVLRVASSADGARYVPGEIARLGIEEPVDGSGFWLPTAALVQGGNGLFSAYAVRPAGGQAPGSHGSSGSSGPERGDHGTVERRELEVLATTGDRSLVRGTLAAGDAVIVEGVHRVVPGQHVRPLSSTPVR